MGLPAHSLAGLQNYKLLLTAQNFVENYIHFFEFLQYFFSINLLEHSYLII